jgi:hypothetical protein
VYEDKTGLSPRRAWTVAWLGGVVIGVGNGVLRQAAYADRLGERAAHNVAEGRTWPFVLAWIAAGPEVTRRLR